MVPIPEKVASSSTIDMQDQHRTKNMSKNGSARNISREQHQQSNRSSRRLTKDDSHQVTTQKTRRRVTAYTTEFTPSPQLAALAAEAATKKNAALDEQIEKPRHRKQQPQQRDENLSRERQMQPQEGVRRQRRATVHEEKERGEDERSKLKKEQTSRRKSLSFHAPSKSPTQRKSVKQSSSSDTHEMSDQEIAEYAGKRAMLRLEQEFSDAAKDRQLARNNSSFHSAASGISINTYDSIMDHKKLSRIPQVSKSDLIIGEYLGRGNFCDVFEVEWAMKNNRGERLNLSDWYDDDSIDSDEDDAEAVRRKMEYLSLMYSNDIRPEIIGTNINGEIDVDAPIIGSRNLRGSFSQIHTGYLINSSARHLRDPNVMALKCLRPAVRAQPRKFVIGAEDLAHETALLSCLDHPNIIKIYGRAKGSFATAFQFGSSKVRVGNENSGKKKERSMNDGYFIILDKLTATLDGTIDDWAEEYEGLSQRLYISAQLPSNVPPPECNLIEHLAKRLKVAYSIARALEYLHSRHVVFRDLKPANVGFDCNDCVKMFDFGFATSIAPLLNEQIRNGREQKGYGPLTETCGTRRYMAPEVALKLGYGKEVDVYSFGMLLWEICAMEKPFDSIKSVDDFHELVVLCGNRPPLNNNPLWTRSLKDLLSRCWSTDPLDRPDMSQVKSMICMVLRDMNVAILRLKQSKTSQNRLSGKREENGKDSVRLTPSQQQPGFLNKWRKRASIA